MAFRVSSAHYGWLANVKNDGRSLSWTKYKAGAALFPDKDQERIHAILCDKGISHDIEYSNVGWYDTH